VPREGERFHEQNHVFEVIDMDRHRVDKVLITPANSPLAGPPSAVSPSDASPKPYEP
jgi:hypothetical protein